MQTRSKKGMSGNSEQTKSAIKAARAEQNLAKEHHAKETGRGQAGTAATGRTIGAATKDNRHGLATDRSDSRRTESRRQGYMGSESKGKEVRKNL